VVSVFEPASTSWSERMLSVVRVVAAFLYMQHGTQKLFHVPASGPPGPVEPFTLLSLNGIAGILEFFGGGMLLLGVLTRPVAFLLAGEMAVAYFKSHAPRAFLPIVNRGELAALLCFLFLYFSVAGAGAWSLDSWFRRRREGVRHTMGSAPVAP
jgi:putative oxidoreductase